MLITSKRVVTTIKVFDSTTGKSHIVTFAPYTTIKDLRSQVNAKFRGIFKSRFFLIIIIYFFTRAAIKSVAVP